MKDNFKITGHFHLEVTDKKTGEVIDSVVEQNQILDTMYDQLINGFFTRSHDNYIITELKLGDDVGTGDNENPEPPAPTYTEVNQNVVMFFSLPGSANESTGEYISTSLQYSKISGKSIRYSIVVDGNDVIDALPGEVDVVYTSATLCTENGKAVAYKRFPFKVVNRLANIAISWTLTFEPC